MLTRFDMSGGPDACWPWLGSHDRKGYPRAKGADRRWLSAYRVVWAELVGPIADEKYVKHTCANRGCVNPKHMTTDPVRADRRVREPRRQPFWKRVMSRVDQSAGAGGCWPWLGDRNSYGYGQVRLPDRTRQGAHRVVWELLVAPIGDGLELEHACHTADLSCPGGVTCPHRRCVNPNHLRPLSVVENRMLPRHRREWRREHAAVPAAALPRFSSKPSTRVTS